jgi:hypothetical protein
LEGGYRQARLNEIVTLCNASINLWTCRKWTFSSQRICALIPPWRGMGDPLVASPIECEGQQGLALRHRTGDMQHPVCGLPRINLPRTPVNKPLADVLDSARWHHEWCRSVGEERIGKEEAAVSSAEENKALVRRFCEAIDEGNLDAMRELLAADFVDHGLLPGQEDRTQHRSLLRFFYFSDRARAGEELRKPTTLQPRLVSCSTANRHIDLQETACAREPMTSYSRNDRRRDQAACKGDPP